MVIMSIAVDQPISYLHFYADKLKKKSELGMACLGNGGEKIL